MSPRPGEVLLVRGLKADGHVYRWWRATVEAVYPDRCALLTRSGEVMHGPKGGVFRHDDRHTFWYQRPYFVTEAYLQGVLDEIFVDITDLPLIADGSVAYTDYELDIVRRPGEPPRVEDEDEFAEAIALYGYSAGLQAACRTALDEALRLIEGWQPGPPPRFEP